MEVDDDVGRGSRVWIELQARKRRTTLRPPGTEPASLVEPASLAAIASTSTTTKPRLAKGKRDVADAPIDHRDAFLLTRIDGRLNVEDLADLTGMPLAEVLQILARLALLRLITL